MALYNLVQLKSWKEYIDYYKSINGIIDIDELEDAAYCPVSITSTPENLRDVISQTHNTLIEILKNAGINAYDPATAPFSLDNNPDASPDEVYRADLTRVAMARYVVGVNLIPSFGMGVEFQAAVDMNKFAVMLLNKNVRVSRMQPHRLIRLAYDDLNQESEGIQQVFELLKEYDPIITDEIPYNDQAGIHKETREVVNIEKIIADKFPQFIYNYSVDIPGADIHVKNPEIF